MKRADILEAARQAVTKDRAATHGKPENTFGLIAGLWSARLGQPISPAQVTIMLIDLKTARAWGNLGHMDNWVDIAGYAACGGELAGDAISARAEPEPDRCEDCGADFSVFWPWRKAHFCYSCETKRAFGMEKEGGGEPPVPADEKPCFYCGSHPDSVIAVWAGMPMCGDCLHKTKDVPTDTLFEMKKKARDARRADSHATAETSTASMAEIKAMIASGEVRPPSPDAPEFDMPEGFWDGAVLMPHFFRADGAMALTAAQRKIVFDAGGIGPMSPAWKSFAMHCGWQIADKNPPELIHEELERAWPFDGERSWHDAATDLGLRWDDLVDFLLGEYQGGAEPPAHDQSPVAVVDFAEEATAEALAQAQDNAKSETPAKAPANSKKCVRCALNGVDKIADFLIGQDYLCSEHFAKVRDGWMGVVDTIKAKPLTEQVDAAPETPAPSPVPEAEKRHHAAKWTPEMDAKLIGGIAAKVANGMLRTTAAKETAQEIGMGEKACVVRAQNVLLAKVTEAIGLAKNAKGIAADMAKTMAPAKAAPAPKPAPQPLSKRLSTTPHVALNIDMHLAECRAEGWAYADDLHLFEMVVDQGYGMGDVALDMGCDSKAIKDRYDRLTGIYQDANSKWCRKYLCDDVLAALRKIMTDGEGVK